VKTAYTVCVAKWETAVQGKWSIAKKSCQETLYWQDSLDWAQSALLSSVHTVK